MQFTFFNICYSPAAEVLFIFVTFQKSSKNLLKISFIYYLKYIFFGHVFSFFEYPQEERGRLTKWSWNYRQQLYSSWSC